MARIDDYRFGTIVIDGHEERSDVIVLPDRTVTNWWRRRGHQLVLEDLEGVLGGLPERLVIGTGAEGRTRGSARRRMVSSSEGVEAEHRDGDRDRRERECGGG